MNMKKVDILAVLIIGIVSAAIAIPILSFIEWELPIIGDYILSLLVIFPIGAIGMLFVAQILAKKMPVVLQVAKCFLVGVMNTFIDFGMLNLLMGFFVIFSGWLYPVFKAMSFTVSAVSSYFWNKYWTFEKKETKPGAGEFGKLYVITGIGFFLNVGVASLLVNVVGPQFGLTEKIWATVAAGLGAFVVFTWNFLGYKFIVFKK